MHEPVIGDRTIKIHVNRMENRTTLKIKSEYYLELLTPETRKLLGSTKNKITKDNLSFKNCGKSISSL